ncbi:MAG: acylase [Bradymonadia bacterium]
MRTLLRHPAVALLGLSLSAMPLTGCDDDSGSDGTGGAGGAGAMGGAGGMAGAGGEGGGGGGGQYMATLERTAYGTAHITAEDWGGLGYGIAWAAAEDHLCTTADQILKAQGKRAEFLGAGPEDAYINSDFGMLHLGLREKATAFFPMLRPDTQALLTGYAAGYNAYLEAVPPADRPAECANADWVRPIEPQDIFAYGLLFSQFSSGLPFLDIIATTQPPSQKSGEDTAPQSTEEALKAMQSNGVPNFRNPSLSSNGWGLGADKTANGRGLLLGNPHFPWEGERRWHEMHLTIPGELDLYGATLVGLPFLGIGFNGNIAWTHTVSSSQRFTGYNLELDPNDPTAYIVDGVSTPMESTEYTIQVRQGDGSLQEVNRTLWRTRHGPMVALGGWTPTLGTAYRDANQDNWQALEMWLAMNRATDLQSFKDAIYTWNANPFINTMFADKEGNAFYMDATCVPNLSQAQLQRWADSIGVDPIATAGFQGFGIVVLDGSTTDNDWVEVDGTRIPGIIPPADAPQLERRDYIFNANDSHWLSNVESPLEGYSPLYGPERTARRPRTRQNAVQILEQDNFDLDTLRESAMSTRGYWAENIRDAVVARCRTAEPALDACDVLENWDGLASIDSRGAALWREFLGEFGFAEMFGSGQLLAGDFDANDPVGTPNGLAEDQGESDAIVDALITASNRLTGAGFALDAPLGEIQFTLKNDERIPVPGGQFFEGMMAIAVYGSANGTALPRMPRGAVVNDATDLTEDGYVINDGNSYVFGVEFTDDGPRAEGILTYSQSGDSRSPHHADQTRLYSEKGWRPLLFDRAQIEADPMLTRMELSGD